MNRTNIGAVAWIACLQYFIAEALTIHGWPGAYSLRDNYISDLGATTCGLSAGAICSPAHAVMNASFLLQGLLIVGGAYCLRPEFAPGRLFAAAFGLIGVAGLGVFLVGLFPEDEMRALHLVGATLNLFCCNAGMVAMGLAITRSDIGGRIVGLTAICAGIAGLIFFGLLGVQNYLGMGVGSVERIAAYPFPVWLACAGVWRWRRANGPMSAPPRRQSP